MQSKRLYYQFIPVTELHTYIIERSIDSNVFGSTENVSANIDVVAPRRIESQDNYDLDEATDIVIENQDDNSNYNEITYYTSVESIDPNIIESSHSKFSKVGFLSY